MPGTIRHLRSLIIPWGGGNHVPPRLLLKHCLGWDSREFKTSLTWGESDKPMCLQRNLELVAMEIPETPGPEGAGRIVPVTKRLPFHVVPRKL